MSFTRFFIYVRALFANWLRRYLEHIKPEARAMIFADLAPHYVRFVNGDPATLSAAAADCDSIEKMLTKAAHLNTLAKGQSPLANYGSELPMYVFGMSPALRQQLIDWRTAHINQIEQFPDQPPLIEISNLIANIDADWRWGE